MSQERVLRELIDLGYEALPEVAGRGEFARRGGIVDVFPAGQPLPVRIEWFGDEIESLRAFDPATQRGVRPVDDVRLLPASEFLLGTGSGASLRAALGHAGQSAVGGAVGRPRPSRAGPARRRRGDLGRSSWRPQPASITSATRSG